MNRVYFLTEGIEVVDIETGHIYFIKGASKIKFVSGTITEARTQEEYNKLSNEK